MGDQISERHRHRYEVNPEVVNALEEAGLIFSGRDETQEGSPRMEIVELPPQTHKFFVACQFHPEFKSRPTRPSPLFLGLVQASMGAFTRKAEPRTPLLGPSSGSQVEENHL
eukprot:TRINITY_DN3328_c0_g1_i11.p1 TRINITY_DN3328_c0_g1~~TRINITY_DN3328_c0_g1_i11.p1  ORF type:complete len:122 (-),score=49.74 TRINITY_DN3328_c0_g1_i11:25-360(-)